MKFSSVIRLVSSIALATVTACGAEVPRPASGFRPSFVVIAVAVGASGCGLADNLAEGFHVDEQRVMTAAHTVRGATSITVRGEPAKLLFIDHRTDVAVLRAPALLGGGHRSAHFATPVLGRATLLRGRHLGGPVERVKMVVTKHAPINIDEPLDSATYRRDGLVTTLDSGSGTVTAGDSGGAIVDDQGAVIGMLFATDTATGTTGYAVSAFELQAALRRTGSEAVPTGSC